MFEGTTVSEIKQSITEYNWVSWTFKHKIADEYKVIKVVNKTQLLALSGKLKNSLVLY